MDQLLRLDFAKRVTEWTANCLINISNISEGILVQAKTTLCYRYWTKKFQALEYATQHCILMISRTPRTSCCFSMPGLCNPYALIMIEQLSGRFEQIPVYDSLSSKLTKLLPSPVEKQLLRQQRLIRSGSEVGSLYIFEVFEKHEYAASAKTGVPLNTTNFITPTTHQTTAQHAETLASITCEEDDLSVSDSHIENANKHPVVDQRATSSQVAMKSHRCDTQANGET